MGYIYRIRTLTHKNLSWLGSFYVIVLWEFSSAVTPSVVGGTAVAVFLLLKEGIKLGKSLAYVMLTAILDNLFFVLAAPLALFLEGGGIFSNIALSIKLGRSLQWIFWLSYTLITLYTLGMFFALFIKPRLFKWGLLSLTRLKFLQKWRNAAYAHGKDIFLASKELRGQKFNYWIKISLATIVIWTARYMILNFLSAAYVPLNLQEHVAIFAKHVVMWVTMLISPTPGSSGTAEFFFKQFYAGMLSQYTLITDISWRVLTYYFYLIFGIICLPRWIKRVFFTKSLNEYRAVV